MRFDTPVSASVSDSMRTASSVSRSVSISLLVSFSRASRVSFVEATSFVALTIEAMTSRTLERSIGPARSFDRAASDWPYFAVEPSARPIISITSSISAITEALVFSASTM